ncbi:hypothetical protein [Methylobacterium thuringiense]|uniref:Uncharacterized protein n=1 Tax=Methylobacterium thuringiense TaxID=1003091 RepID=A0ABQ4TRH8_9HYPH|nr:hypothetical protein [Methylobacterium thuringiense]GJE57302.1 hypothetical protein EKPJFOCH_3816 [Methylobacterium thuringiense]
MLMQTYSGVLNTDHIVSVDPCAPVSKGERCEVKFTDGSTRFVNLPLDHFEQAAGTIVPALPGFMLIEAVMPHSGDEEHGVFYRESPVIAFRIASGDKGPVPITVEGEPTGGLDHSFVVQQPNGPCAGPNGWYENVTAFKAERERALSSRAAA